MTKKLLFLIPFVFALSCKRHVSSSETLVYTNDFEGNNLSKIDNAIVGQFNNSTVLGFYNSNTNKGYFKLVVDNLPKHELISISFDLYIHDSWDGNITYLDGPDIWQMMVDDAVYINATFSNLACIAGNFCPPQSYPFNYPNSYNNPRKGAYRTDLPGICSMAGSNGTSQYKITKTFTHSSSTLILQCLDKLVSNATDKLCDESWSVDNINIKAITL